ncbi:MAG: ATP-binding cassette domain-containing protein [Clostridiales bacterium]|nr:ATP-binding cassette domain-containing protein [Clostridiales bacterium]
MGEILIRTSDLSKEFRDKKAVDGVSLNIRSGSIYGLIGRNGAGKTTFMRMICGMTSPTSGEIIYKDGGAPDYGKIGALIELPAINPKLSAFANLKLKCLAYGITDKKYMMEKLELVGLSLVCHKKVEKYSLGMRQRLGIALALVGDPEILVLDEPVNGLDPQGIAEVRDLLTYLNGKYHTTIIISSHILEELAKFVTDYAIIDNGKILEESTMEDLEKRCTDSIVIKSSETEMVLEGLKKMGIEDFKVSGKKTILVYTDTSRTSEINMNLAKADVPIESISVAGADLEEYFMRLTGTSSKIR